jgi:hypothetical protein
MKAFRICRERMAYTKTLVTSAMDGIFGLGPSYLLSSIRHFLRHDVFLGIWSWNRER